MFRCAKSGVKLHMLPNLRGNIPAFAHVSEVELYRYGWQAELFFTPMERYSRIKLFVGTSKNAAKTQLRNAVAVYVLVAIFGKRLSSSGDRSTMLQNSAWHCSGKFI